MARHKSDVSNSATSGEIELGKDETSESAPGTSNDEERVLSMR